MSIQTTSDSKSTEQTLVEIVRSLPDERAVQILNYARHVQIQAREAMKDPVQLEDRSPAATAKDFWNEKTLEELAHEQGIQAMLKPENIFGAGRNLWDNDADFESFVSEIEKARDRNTTS